MLPVTPACRNVSARYGKPRPSGGSPSPAGMPPPGSRLPYSSLSPSPFLASRIRQILFTASHRDHNAPPPHRMLHQFVRPCDLCKWNALGDLEPGPPRLKRIVQIPRRLHLGL